MVKFKVDENLPTEAAELLAAAGHDALTVQDQQMSGHADSAVTDVCRNEGRALVTLDLDFADIRAYPPADYPGIVVLRLARFDKHRVMLAIQRLSPTLGHEVLAGKLWIVEEAKIRIRS
jgi:predicted nuclease of predicted toxin-antitoxin system